MLLLGRWIHGAEHYYLQQFVDSGELIQEGLHGYDEKIMKQALEIVRSEVPNAQLRGV